MAGRHLTRSSISQPKLTETPSLRQVKEIPQHMENYRLCSYTGIGGGGAAPILATLLREWRPRYTVPLLGRTARYMFDDSEARTAAPYEPTSAIGVGHDKIEDVNYGDAIQYMDYIFAMTYDFYGGWNNVLGHQTALTAVTSCALVNVMAQALMKMANSTLAQAMHHRQRHPITAWARCSSEQTCGWYSDVMVVVGKAYYHHHFQDPSDSMTGGR